jgi:predicted nucleotidyltransferase
VRIFWLDRERVLAGLRAAVRRLKAAHPEIEEVLLFGSMARDEAVPGSDADLLVILSESDEPFLERIPRYLLDGVSVAVDVFPYTRVELETMSRAGNHFIGQALAEGIRLTGEAAGNEV